VVIGAYDSILGHNVPQVFIDFQNLTGQIWDGSKYVTGKIYTDNPTANVFGLPVTESYWIKSVVAGQEKDVLVQLFERRVLTYTPSNALAFRVEMGNVGQHYYQWRYGNQTPPPATTPSPQTTTTPAQPSPTSRPPVPTPTPGGGLPANCFAGSGAAVEACVSNKAPNQRTEVTVFARLIVNGQVVSGVPMQTVWNYKTTKAECNSGTDASGIARCTRNIGGASEGFEVIIDISFSYNGQTYTGKTSFTPV
jgi:hypothetical protein